jgi:hypothetical protein
MASAAHAEPAVGDVSGLKTFFVATFGDEHALVQATAEARAAGLPIHDCYTPYPVHGLDDAMGLKRSWLPYASFGFGCFGFLLAFSLQVHTQFVDFVPIWKGWPIIVGGKPFLPWPAFVPVFFELTVLCTGHLTVLTYLIYRRLLPGMKPKIHIDGVTDDRFAIALDPAAAGFDEASARALFASHHVLEIMNVEGKA